MGVIRTRVLDALGAPAAKVVLGQTALVDMVLDDVALDR